MDTTRSVEYRKIGAAINDLRNAQPAVMAGFGAMHEAARSEGTLTAKTKELMALAIAISTQCSGCIIFHVHDAIELGATRDEISETIGVAVLMGGGPSVIYGTEALEVFDEAVAPHRLGLPEGDGPLGGS